MEMAKCEQASTRFRDYACAEGIIGWDVSIFSYALCIYASMLIHRDFWGGKATFGWGRSGKWKSYALSVIMLIGSMLTDRFDCTSL
jgi:hypothetical protein